MRWSWHDGLQLGRFWVRVPHQPYTILVVEDNPADARLVTEACSAALAVGVHTVRTGTEALDFVNQRGEYTDAPRPDLVLLDWHLPGKGGKEVLAALNGDPNHDDIPVIVVTGSQSEAEIRTAYKPNANACITKDAAPDELETTLEAFEDFWLSAARLPRVEDP